ncbi:hypothetical protein EGW08_000480, partial [Elysia chlorotica]
TSFLMFSANCIFVNANLNKALEDSIWKKKTGFNLANYNMDETLSELSICLEEKSESSSPLRVDLPPPKLDTETSKMLRLDHIGIRRADRQGGQDKARLNIEELECGVQLEGSDTAKQEWSFTLYDFDGHGRITKEDLASLLKALYDAVGSSIKLPPNGAKTLKLRLSVGQDGGAATIHHVTQGEEDVHCGSGNNSNGKNNFNNIAITKKNNISGGAAQMANLASRASERSRNTARAPKNKVREFSKLNNLTRAAAAEQKQQKQQLVKRTNEHRGQARLASLSDKEKLDREAKLLDSREKKNCFSRANGERGSKLGEAVDSPAKRPEVRAEESQDRRNYYLDLAGVENTSSRFQNVTRGSHSRPVCSRRCHKGHHRSRSQDLATLPGSSAGAELKFSNVISGNDPESCSSRLVVPSTTDQTKRDYNDQPAVGGHLNSLNLTLNCGSSTTTTGTTATTTTDNNNVSASHNTRGRRFRPLSLPGHVTANVPGHVSPHHHRRHRHRDKEHSQAMQHVAQWIEREQHAWDHQEAGTRTAAAEGHILVQRHEHHHIHEHHHHHHYHHYHET